jgi:ADP-ribose pyrophosphatase YjhB (NUDIX family)
MRSRVRDFRNKDESRHVGSGQDSDENKNPSTNRLLLLGYRNSPLLIPCLVLLLLNFLQWRQSLHCPVSVPSKLQNSAAALRSTAGSSDPTCQISLGHYIGPVYHSPPSGTIGEPKCLLDSKWMQVNLHTVRFPGTDTVFDDWMWIDYHDRINVVVEDETHFGEERRFLVFEQTKYALDGRSSLAIVGGIIEPSEDAETAARREVYEEMDGLSCENFHFLGRYRTDVNRGMGWLNSFLATKCSRESKSNINHSLTDEIGAADTEKQKLKSITLTELNEAARKGKFLEVQWTATVAQALLHPELRTHS